MNSESFSQHMAAQLILVDDPVVAAKLMYDFVEKTLTDASDIGEQDLAQEYSMKVMQVITAIDPEYATKVADKYFELTINSLLDKTP